MDKEYQRYNNPINVMKDRRKSMEMASKTDKINLPK
jgi:hypothetical protein